MTTVLAISSQVIYGPVGNSAAVPAMRALGLRVLELPTVLLSNHPGHGAPVRHVTAAETMAAMLARVEGHGWMEGLAGIMTGYFADAAQIEVAADLIARLKDRGSGQIYLCDPIVGDDRTDGSSGLYVPEGVAGAIRSRLLPLADFVSPNRFELAWLTGRSVTGPASAAEAARDIAPRCLATSIPLGGDGIATMLIDGGAACLVETRRRERVPHGTGDLLSGLMLGHLLAGRGGGESLALSIGAVEAVLDASRGSDALELAGLARRARRLAVRPLEVRA